MHKPFAKSGFTLIELSIVLVIISLVIGGILTGRELIYSSQIQKMGTDLSKIQTAFTTFRVKYNCLPGDCDNAETYFGTNSAGCPGGGGATGTCNGNGDGIINASWSNGNLEDFYGWQQLITAGFIPWSVINTSIKGTGYAYIGKNVPASSWNPTIGYLLYSSRSSVYAIPASSTAIQIGATCQPTNWTDFLWGTGLTAPQSKDLDAKFDDGAAKTGIIEATDENANTTPAASGNQNTTCLASNAYSTSNATGCVLYYWLKNQ